MKELHLYGSIGDSFFDEDAWTAARFAKEAKGAKGLTVRINSPGGQVFEGQAIVAEMRRVKSSGHRVDVSVDGIAASIASIIAIAGDRVTMSEGAYMMIHNPYTVTVGDSDEHRKTADELDKFTTGLVNQYVKRSAGVLDEVEVRDMMDNTTWLNAEEAVGFGLADVVDDTTEAIAARISEDISGLDLPAGMQIHSICARSIPRVIVKPERKSTWEERRAMTAALAAAFALP